MTTPLTKLIAENKERPIAAYSDAHTHDDINYGDWYLVKSVDGCIYKAFIVFNCTRHQWGVEGKEFNDEAQPFNRFTHFRPLPDDRLARCFEILLNAALSAKEQNHIYEAAADIEVALQQITAIAEGKE